jgi:hypothetical protein
MNDAVRSSLAAWSDFYVIVGSSAAALTGLQFVVIALVNDLRQAPSEQTLAAFSTPTVVHFALALLTSATLASPWPALWQAGLTAAACGVGGFIYELVVRRRTRVQTQYKPVWEDWVWHIVLPLVAYASLTLSAVLLDRYQTWAPFGIGAAVLLMVFIGIHNAWDTVTYVALQRTAASNEQTHHPGEGP